MAKKKSKSAPELFAEFKIWIAARGGEVLEPTNQWEVVRFRGEGKTSIIYTKKNGGVTFTGDASAAWNAFERRDDTFRLTKKAPRMSQAKREPIVRTLIERDGNRCFYCATSFDEVKPTKEHLVPRTAGGPDHLSNLFLSCEPCNQEVGHASAPEKIRFRDLKRRGVGTQILQRIQNVGACLPDAMMTEIALFLNPTTKEPIDARH